MEYAVLDLPSEWTELHIYPLGDLHIGDPRFAEDLFLEVREEILQKQNAIVLLNGDILNCATKTSKSDIYEEVMNPHQALKYAKKLLEPIRDQVKAITQGNHEARIARDTSIDVAEHLAEYCGCAYSREGILMKIRFGKKRNLKKCAYTLYMMHGWTGSRFIGGKALNLQRLSDIVLADIYVMGHTHQIQTFRDRYYVPDVRNDNLMIRERVYVNTGAFLDYGGYGEAKGYRPTELGAPVVVLDGTKKDIRVEV